MHKYVAQQQSNGVFVLVKDGNNACCPKTMAVVPSQTPMGQMAMSTTQNACSTGCPFAEVKKTKCSGPDNTWIEQDVYEISCEGRTKEIVLDEIKLLNKPKGGNLIVQ